MKKTITMLSFLFIATISLAQRGINYKALITNSGAALNTQNVNIKFTVLENGTSSVYQETQTTTTDTNGIVSVQVGEGTQISGNFNSIDWANNQYLHVEIDTGSGYEDFGITAFQDVPYAKHAETASYVENTFWHQTFNAINSVNSVGIGEDTTNEANLHINDVTGGLPLIKMTSDDNIYTIWQSDRAGVDDYLIGIDGGNNKFLFANTSTNVYPLTLQEARVGINNLNPNANLDVIGSIKYVDGNESAGKVLTSDASGNATWQTTATGATELNDLSDAISSSSFGSSIFIGNGAGVHDDGTANYNVGIGANALHANITGQDNTANGYNSLSNTTGSSNTANGSFSLMENTTGNNNTANGSFSLMENTTGNNNTATGIKSLYNNTTGQDNTANGAYSLRNNVLGSNNTAIGNGSGYYATGEGNIFIGYRAGYYELGNNKLYIENTNSTTPLIEGDFSTDEVTINGNMEITGDVQGKIKAVASGDTDMKAYIYGSITAAGSNSPNGAHSDGYTVSTTSTGYYTVSFTAANAPAAASQYTVMVNTRNENIGFITVNNDSTSFTIKTYNTAGTLANKAFNFVVFKK